jgi:hypothetical protein
MKTAINTFPNFGYLLIYIKGIPKSSPNIEGVLKDDICVSTASGFLYKF